MTLFYITLGEQTPLDSCLEASTTPSALGDTFGKDLDTGIEAGQTQQTFPLVKIQADGASDLAGTLAASPTPSSVHSCVEPVGIDLTSIDPVSLKLTGIESGCVKLVSH